MALIAQGQNLSGGDQSLSAQAINLTGSQTSARNLTATASSGDINLASATVAVGQTLTANASQTLRTDNASISATQINAAAHDLSNVQGAIVQTGSGDLTLNLPGTLNNAQGRIATNSANLNLTAATLTNTDGKLEHAGTGALTINASTLDGAHGQIASNGLLDLSATSTTLDAAATTAKQLAINSNTLSNRGGTLTQTGSGAATLAALTQLDNTGGTIASNG
jgi:filamentous hemagglutinin